MPFGPTVRSITQPGGNFLAIFVMKGELFIFLTLFACLMRNEKENIFMYVNDLLCSRGNSSFQDCIRVGW